jgi:hypothetical protein
MERTTVDSKRFDGLARTVADRGAERDRDWDQFEALTRLVARKGSRRVALAGLPGVVLFGQRAHSTDAQCRSKEGKDKRQCRRKDREKNAPGSSSGGTCGQDKLFGLCTVFDAVPCCNSMECVGTLAPFVTGCQYLCDTDGDCTRKFPHKALACRDDALVCPLVGKCCVPR